MPPDARSDRAKEIFGDALEHTSEQRREFLGRACSGDAALRAEVDALIAAHQASHGFLAEPASAAPLPPAVGIGERVGRYRIVRPIGEGGIGSVFLAEQLAPVKRMVALKIVKLGMDTRQVIARFEAEQQTLAALDHPSIARVLDAGATESGRPYFAMEFVEGESITAYCDRHRLGTAARLEIFVEVCAAVQHAHQKGIIHRDIKPSNVLVATVDGKPRPKVIDFGIAKATASPLSERTALTELGQLVGTPQYMSPEQAAPSAAADVDTRSDVYSLGVLLYELLTGATPIARDTLRSAAWDEILRVIREVEPARPSTRLSAMGSEAEAVAEQRRTEPARLLRAVRGDLDWIAMKCLEKDRACRYDTVGGLAADVQHHLAGEPVLAAPPSAAYRARKFIRRHRTAASAAAAIALALVLGALGTTLGLVRASRQRDAALGVASFLEQMLGGVRASVALGRDTTVLREMLDAATRPILEGAFAATPQVDVALRVTTGRVYRDIGEFAAARRVLEPALAVAERDAPALPLASALSDWGVLLLDEGRAVDALPFLERALAMRRRLVPGDDPDVARDLSRVSRAKGDLHRIEDALELASEALAMRQRLGEDEPTAVSMRIVGNCLHALGRFEEAEPMLRGSVEMLERLYPEGHPEALASMNDLANAMQGLGRLEEAETRYERTLAMARGLYAHDHPRLANSLNSMGGIRLERGDSEGAVEAFEEALAMRRRLFAPDHPLVLGTLDNLALALYGLGLLDAAEEVLKSFPLEGAAAPGADRSAAVGVLIGLSRIHLDRGRFDEAERELLEAWERRPAGPDPRTDAIVRGLVAVYEAWETAEPGSGHAASAAPWRARIDAGGDSADLKR